MQRWQSVINIDDDDEDILVLLTYLLKLSDYLMPDKCEIDQFRTGGERAEADKLDTDRQVSNSKTVTSQRENPHDDNSHDSWQFLTEIQTFQYLQWLQ